MIPCGLQLTISLGTLGSGALTNLALVLQVEVPALLLTILVLQVECNDGLGRVNRILLLGLIGLQGLVDRVERGGGGERICGVSCQHVAL